MAELHIVTGRLNNGRHVELDESVPLPDARVRVTIEPLADRPVRPLHEVLSDIRQQQQEREHVPPTPEEVDRYLAAERASWD